MHLIKGTGKGVENACAAVTLQVITSNLFPKILLLQSILLKMKLLKYLSVWLSVCF